MANSIRLPVIVLDTFTSAIDLGDTLFDDSNAAFWLKSIIWENPTTQDHTAVVKDGAGNTLFTKTANAARDIIEQTYEMWVRGLTISASGVGSGKIVIVCG